jgi:hypothetical protein
LLWPVLSLLPAIAIFSSETGVDKGVGKKRKHEKESGMYREVTK